MTIETCGLGFATIVFLPPVHMINRLRAAFRTALTVRFAQRSGTRQLRFENFEQRRVLASNISDLTSPTSSTPLTAEGEAGEVFTWSIAKDGTSVSVSGKPGTEPSNLQSTLNSYYGSRGNWQSVFQAALDVWDVPGVTFVPEAEDDGAALPESVGQAGQRGRIRFAGTDIDSAGGVLAEANSGEDVVLDTGFGQGEAFLRQLYIVLVHEIGHVLGLEHMLIERPEVSSRILGVMQ